MWIAFLVSVEKLATAAQMPLTNCYSRVLGVIDAAECWLVYLFPVSMTWKYNLNMRLQKDCSDTK